MIYYDTVNDSTRKKTDVFYQSSTDDGVTFGAAQKVTTAMTDETVSGADSGNQYGDYNSLSGIGGVFFPSWTDRRSGSSEEIWTAKLTEGGTPIPTYSISGSAGTAGATVTAGGISATSDATSAYSVAGLSAGTYTVTPSKTGCTFSPASQSVTVGPNATGINFTATCTSGDKQLTSGVPITGQSVRQERLEVLLHHGTVGRDEPRVRRRRPPRATSTSTPSSMPSRRRARTSAGPTRPRGTRPAPPRTRPRGPGGSGSTATPPGATP